LLRNPNRAAYPEGMNANSYADRQAVAELHYAFATLSCDSQQHMFFGLHRQTEYVAQCCSSEVRQNHQHQGKGSSLFAVDIVHPRM
jgi:hypothetical protein